MSKVNFFLFVTCRICAAVGLRRTIEPEKAAGWESNFIADNITCVSVVHPREQQ